MYTDIERRKQWCKDYEIKRRESGYYKQPHVRERRMKYSKWNNERMRKLVIGYYSNYTFKCACCGEAEYKFLSMDHIIPIGRKTRTGSGTSLYAELISKKFPSGYQVLCYNCNCCKGFYGSCIHKWEESKGINEKDQSMVSEKA